MDVFYFIIVITLLICYFYKVDENNPKEYRQKLFWVFLPVFIYGALRVDFGIDYPTYESEFYLLNGKPQNIDPLLHSELGFQWLEVIFPSWRFMVVFNTLLIVFGIASLCYKFVEPSMLLFVVLLTFLSPNQSFFLNFVAMRNGIAIGAFFISIPLIVKRKYLPLLAIAVILSFVHKSAIIFIPMALLVGQTFSISKKEIRIWVCVFILFALTSSSKLIDIVLPFFSDNDFESFQHYLVDSGHSSWLYASANAFFIYWIFKWAMRNKDVLSTFQNTMWRLAMLYLMCPFLGTLGRTRMNYYFFPFYVITMAYMAKDRWPNKGEKTVFICLAISIMIYQTFVLWMNNARFPYSHYHSILQGIWG